MAKPCAGHGRVVLGPVEEPKAPQSAVVWGLTAGFNRSFHGIE